MLRGFGDWGMLRELGTAAGILRHSAADGDHRQGVRLRADSKQHPQLRRLRPPRAFGALGAWGGRRVSDKPGIMPPGGPLLPAPPYRPCSEGVADASKNRPPQPQPAHPGLHYWPGRAGALPEAAPRGGPTLWPRPGIYV